MTNEDTQKFDKNGLDGALISFAAWTKAAQEIAVEVVDYSKKTAEHAVAAWEKLMGAKNLEQATELQNEYLRSSYEGLLAEAAKLGELYADLAKESYRPFESVLAAPIK